MSYKAWDEEYDNLLARANLQPLAKRRKFQGMLPLPGYEWHF